MASKIYLKVVDFEAGDSVLVIAGKDGVLMKGDNPDENLACGNCKTVIARHVSTRMLYERFTADKRLLCLCRCGAHNLVPSQLNS